MEYYKKKHITVKKIITAKDEMIALVKPSSVSDLVYFNLKNLAVEDILQLVKCKVSTKKV